MKSELNKAAEEYAQDETMSGLAERAFKAGAEWQREQYGCIPAEEAYMRGFAQGAKEERKRMREDIKEIYGKAVTEFAVHLVRTDSEPDCTTAKCGIRYALNALLSWLKANGYDVDAKE